VAIAGSSAVLLAVGQPVSASIVPTVPLATSSNYSVLASSTVTNTNPSVIGQSVGLSPGTSITGFPPGIVLPPATIEAANAVTLQAQQDLTVAYVDAATRGVEFTVVADLVGQTLAPGVYEAPAHGPLGLSGQLVLDGQGNSNAVFIFQTDSTLITSTGSTIALINGASECNVFWQVGSSATLGSGSLFVGNILALTSITVESSVVVHGRALARNGAVTLDNNVFTQPSCAPTTDLVPTATAPSTTTAPAATPAPTSPASTVPGNTGVTPTTAPFNATDITLPATGKSTATMSVIGLAALLMGIVAIVITRRREPA
jgi:type VI secretion system secreted protein VgrG